MAATTTAPRRSSAPTCSGRAATGSTRTTTATRSPTTEGDNNPQSAEGLGGSLRLDYDFDGDTTLTSITAYEETESSSLGDIDGGFGADFLPVRRALPAGQHSRAIPAYRSRRQTQDGIDDLDQFTQEFRLASQASEELFWQAGVYYFDSKFSRDDACRSTSAGPDLRTTVTHENTAWAVFGHLSYDVSPMR